MLLFFWQAGYLVKGSGLEVLGFCNLDPVACNFYLVCHLKTESLAPIVVEILFCFRKNTSTALGVTKQKDCNE